MYMFKTWKDIFSISYQSSQDKMFCRIFSINKLRQTKRQHASEMGYDKILKSFTERNLIQKNDKNIKKNTYKYFISCCIQSLFAYMVANISSDIKQF